MAVVLCVKRDPFVRTFSYRGGDVLSKRETEALESPGDPGGGSVLTFCTNSDLPAELALFSDIFLVGD